MRESCGERTARLSWFWRFVCRAAAAVEQFRGNVDQPYVWGESWGVAKGTLGYGIYYNGREVWSGIHGDFLASRWWEEPGDAIAAIPEAMRDLSNAATPCVMRVASERVRPSSRLDRARKLAEIFNKVQDPGAVRRDG